MTAQARNAVLAAVWSAIVATAIVASARWLHNLPPPAPAPASSDAAPRVAEQPREPPLHVVLDMAEEDARRFAGNCRGCRVELVGLDLVVNACDCSPAAMDRLMRNLHGISVLRSVDCTSPRHHRHIDLSPP